MTAKGRCEILRITPTDCDCTLGRTGCRSHKSDRPKRKRRRETLGSTRTPGKCLGEIYVTTTPPRGLEINQTAGHLTGHSNRSLRSFKPGTLEQPKCRSIDGTFREKLEKFSNQGHWNNQTAGQLTGLSTETCEA